MSSAVLADQIWKGTSGGDVIDENLIIKGFPHILFHLIFLRVPGFQGSIDDWPTNHGTLSFTLL